jgi:hypothetical protein
LRIGAWVRARVRIDLRSPLGAATTHLIAATHFAATAHLTAAAHFAATTYFAATAAGLAGLRGTALTARLPLSKRWRRQQQHAQRTCGR